jgi:hypothetical protein
MGFRSQIDLKLPGYSHSSNLQIIAKTVCVPPEVRTSKFKTSNLSEVNPSLYTTSNDFSFPLNPILAKPNLLPDDQHDRYKITEMSNCNEVLCQLKRDSVFSIV